MEIGDKVWFTSKYGDRVEGTYEGPTKVGHLIKSFNAFGITTEEPTMCLVQDLTKVHRIA